MGRKHGTFVEGIGSVAVVLGHNGTCISCVRVILFFYFFINLVDISHKASGMWNSEGGKNVIAELV